MDGNNLDLAYSYAAIGTRMAVSTLTWALCLLPLTSVMCRMDVLKYWNQILYPQHDNTTCVVLQVLKGSHLCGRIEHIKVGEQTGADMERVEQIMKVPEFWSDSF